MFEGVSEVIQSRIAPHHCFSWYSNHTVSPSGNKSAESPEYRLPVVTITHLISLSSRSSFCFSFYPFLMSFFLSLPACPCFVPVYSGLFDTVTLLIVSEQMLSDVTLDESGRRDDLRENVD